MKKILKILSSSTLWIILVIGLLFMQAQGDLALPDYTSNIINVGIQTSGIEDAVPSVIRKSTLDNIILFSDNKDLINDSYKLIKKGDKKYKEDYPLVKKEDLYILKNIDKQEREKLNDEIKNPLVFVGVMSSDNKEVAKMIGENKMEGNLFEMIPYMSEKDFAKLKKEVNDKFNDLEPSIIDQLSSTMVKQEYEVIGVDIDAIQIDYLIKTGIKMILVALGIAIVAISINFISSKVASRFARDLRSEVVSKVMNFSNKEFEEFSTASLITRSTNDIQQVQMVFTMLLRMLIYAPILGIGALIKINNNDMSWVIVLGIAAIVVIIFLMFTFVMPKFKIFQKLVDRINLVSREILTGIPVIRAFSTEKHEEERFDVANKDLTKNSLFIGRAMSLMSPTMMLIMNLICILIVWVGSKKVDLGTMQVGTLIAFMTYAIQVIMSFLMIAMTTIMLPRAWVSVKRIGEILNKEVSIKEKEETKKFDNKQKGVVEFKDVYFRYPDAEEDVIENINFKATPGTTTAFIGSTGSGKSTLINLIPRFFDVTAGKILIDGVDIRDVKLKDLRKKIGYVPQKGQLFTGTIKNNIGFGQDKINQKEVLKAASIAQATDFIEAKEEKYDSPISQGGTNVSGGQRQRLSIARAIYKNPEIFIFDDSFSALDYKTDVKLRKALDKELKNATIFIVAQRISTILKADQIIVLDEGMIVGKGTHQSLMKECSVYKEIALSQLSEEELKNEA